jgi:hypothetical protein
VYINDIVDNIEGNVKLFADDTALYIDVEKLEKGERILNNDLEKLNTWAQQWLVKFNASKTVAMKISLKRQTDQANPNLFFQNEQVSLVQSHRHLGLTINAKLKWNEHILNITNKAKRQIDIMKRLKFKLDRKTLETVYITYVRPSLEYGCVVWDNCDNESKLLLEGVQLAAARIVTGAIRGTSHDKLYEETGWETLESRRKRQKLLLFHKMVYGVAPTYLCELIPPRVRDINPYSRRFGDHFSGVYSRIELHKQSFIPSVVEEWNRLPLDIRNTENYASFKRLLMKDKSKHNKLYYCGNRHESIIHARLRMNCSCLKDHLYKMHVIENDICNCLQASETTEHYLLYCPLYLRQRRLLFREIKERLHITDAQICRNLLLYGNNEFDDSGNEFIFDSVHKFIIDSKRFDT